MIKFTVVLLLVAVTFADSSIIRSPAFQNHNELKPISETDLAAKWGQHIMDFLNLIDINDVMTIVMEYIQDPEVQEFIQFMTSPKVPELVKEFESIEEFMEAVDFMESKGYEAKYIINVFNSFMKLPPLGEQKLMLRNNKGMAGFIEDIMAVIPGDEIKDLFESKLENSPEVAELYATITSEEFVDIMKRMSKNPKFEQIMEKLEGYGFDSKFVCDLAQKVFGEYYQGIFCE